MIEFLSNWAKGLGLAIVIVSVLEMLMPNNKTKKYIRMVMGVFILFTIVSPFVQNKEIFNINNIDIEKYSLSETSTTVNQTSMNERIQELYVEELEKDISEKVEEQGYNVKKCKVIANVLEKENTITKIKLNIEKKQNIQTGSENKSVENRVVTEIQKIKDVNTSLKSNLDIEPSSSENNKLLESDIQNLKKLLIEKYEVNEKCLEIN